MSHLLQQAPDGNVLELRRLLDELGNCEVQVAACSRLREERLRTDSEYARRVRYRDEAVQAVVDYVAALRSTVAPQGEAERLDHAFHRCWTACVGTPGYDKSVWLATSAQLHDAMRAAPVVPDAENDLKRLDHIGSL